MHATLCALTHRLPRACDRDIEERYEGQWSNGLQHGKGTHVWLKEQSEASPFRMQEQYKGEWKQGLRHGFGIFMYANASWYEGEWQENQKEIEKSLEHRDPNRINALFKRLRKQGSSSEKR